MSVASRHSPAAAIHVSALLRCLAHERTACSLRCASVTKSVGLQVVREKIKTFAQASVGHATTPGYPCPPFKVSAMRPACSLRTIPSLSFPRIACGCGLLSVPFLLGSARCLVTGANRPPGDVTLLCPLRTIATTPLVLSEEQTCHRFPPRSLPMSRSSFSTRRTR